MGFCNASAVKRKYLQNVRMSYNIIIIS